MENVFIETYGCSANQNNSEIIAGILTRADMNIVKDEENADIIILNSCVVKSKTESKIKRRMQDLRQFSSKKLMIIAGCMAQTDYKKIKKLNKNAVFLGTNNCKDILNIIRDWKERQFNEKKQEEYLKRKEEIKLNLPKIPVNNLISIHQISEGCLGECTYCKTKFAKGKLFSYPKEEIIKSIESDLTNGAKEVWITSQDNASYGLDWKEKKQELVELLKSILDLKHKFRLRLGMMNPEGVQNILEDLIELYKNKKMYKFLHMPIQSASNSVLEHMKRKYKIEEAEKIIKRFKQEFQDSVIATDIIVGYPNETEKDHEENMEFVAKFKPDVLNISKFSSHKDTEAGKMKVIPNAIVKKRTTELMKLHRKTALENKQRYLGKKIKVFINRRIGESLHEAREENYNIVLVKCDKSMLGKEIEVKIKEVGVHHMIGEV